MLLTTKGIQNVHCLVNFPKEQFNCPMCSIEFGNRDCRPLRIISNEYHAIYFVVKGDDGFNQRVRFKYYWEVLGSVKRITSSPGILPLAVWSCSTTSSSILSIAGVIQNSTRFSKWLSSTWLSPAYNLLVSFNTQSRQYSNWRIVFESTTLTTLPQCGIEQYPCTRPYRGSD